MKPGGSETSQEAVATVQTKDDKVRSEAMKMGVGGLFHKRFRRCSNYEVASAILVLSQILCLYHLSFSEDIFICYHCLEQVSQEWSSPFPGFRWAAVAFSSQALFCGAWFLHEEGQGEKEPQYAVGAGWGGAFHRGHP